MTLKHYLVLAAILFAIGIYGMLTRRHLVGMLISVELMLNATIINFMAFARYKALDASAGPVFSLFIIAIAASEMAVALAFVVSMFRRHRQLDVDSLKELHD